MSDSYISSGFAVSRAIKLSVSQGVNRAFILICRQVANRTFNLSVSLAVNRASTDVIH